MTWRENNMNTRCSRSADNFSKTGIVTAFFHPMLAWLLKRPFATVRVVFSKNTPCLAHDSKVGFGINRGG